MHLLGIAGMPRRVSTYSSELAFLNNVASFGSMISFISSIIFFYILIKAVRNKQQSLTWMPISYGYIYHQNSYIILTKKSKVLSFLKIMRDTNLLHLAHIIVPRICG